MVGTLLLYEGENFIVVWFGVFVVGYCVLGYLLLELQKKWLISSDKFKKVGWRLYMFVNMNMFVYGLSDGSNADYDSDNL